MSSLPPHFIKLSSERFEQIKEDVNRGNNTEFFNNQNWTVVVLPQQTFVRSFQNYYKEDYKKYIERAEKIYGKEKTIIVGASYSIEHCSIDVAIYLDESDSIMYIAKNIEFVEFDWLEAL